MDKLVTWVGGFFIVAFFAIVIGSIVLDIIS